MKPEEIIEEVKKAGLRGRGGAGFPTGVKWGFIQRDSKKPIYLCCNADESEPGSFKDREILERDPHQMLEGIIIGCYTINSHKSYIYIRGEMPYGASIIEGAIGEAYEKGYLGKHLNPASTWTSCSSGAGAYMRGGDGLESMGKNESPGPNRRSPAQIGSSDARLS
jgi:NADH-quinone oxidoreductase subunit F